MKGSIAVPYSRPPIGLPGAAVTAQVVRSKMALSTTVIVGGALMALLLSTIAGEVLLGFRVAAWVFTGALALGLMVEATAGLRNLMRTDVVMFLALYTLTFLEYLFPQTVYFETLSLDDSKTATAAVLLGFAAIAIGRHAYAPRDSSVHHSPAIEFTSRQIISAYFIFFFLGYFYVFLSVNFDPFEVVRQLGWPRFSQSWSRGRIGGWLSFLTELNLLTYLIPPLAAAIFAQRHRYSATQKVFVAIVLIFVLYFAFASGTRSVFLVQVGSFVIAFMLLQEKLNIKKFVRIGLVAAFVMAAGSGYMLEFRKIGLSGYDNSVESEFSSVYVDQTLQVLTTIVGVFPQVYDYLGLEIPYQAVIHPIPRALWPGKPEGLSIGIEEAAGRSGYGVTLAITFVGELYMAGGLFAVGLCGLALGAAASWWNRVGSEANSIFGLVLFCSGFFAASTAMRSFLWVGPAILPVVALWIYGKYFLKLRHPMTTV